MQKPEHLSAIHRREGGPVGAVFPHRCVRVAAGRERIRDHPKVAFLDRVVEPAMFWGGFVRITLTI